MPEIVTDYAVTYPWKAYKNGNNTFIITLTENGAAFDTTDYTFILNVRTPFGEINRLQLTQGSGITNGGATGVITITLSQAQASVTLPRDYYFWELSYTFEGITYRMFSGGLTLSEDVNTSTSTAISRTISLAGTPISVALSVPGGDLVNATSVTNMKTKSVNQGQLIRISGTQGGMFYYDNTDVSTAEDGGVVFVRSDDKRIKRFIENTELVNPEWFGITNDGVLTAAANWDKFFAYVKANGKTASFLIGTYVLPYNYTYDFGANDLKIQGVPGKTIITAASGVNSVKIPPRIDITQPAPTVDGVYQVWTTGPTIHADYNGLTLSLDDYIQVASGVVTELTLAQVKALHYVTELDLTGSEPASDGLYVCAEGDWVSGGGFPNLTLSWEPTIKVTLGAIVQNTSGTWSRYSPSLGLKFNKNFHCSGVTFQDIPFFLLSPFGSATDKDFLLENCTFKYVRRVLSMDRILSSDSWVWGETYTAASPKFSFSSFTIRNCTFDHVHESIAWFIPPTKRLYIDNNKLINCHNIQAGFVYIPSTNAAFYQKSLQVNSIHSNKIVDCITRAGGTDGTKLLRWFFRTVNNGDIHSNEFINYNGLSIYVSGNNSRVYSNYFEPFIQFVTGSLDGMLVKGQPLEGINQIYDNTHIGGVASFFAQDQDSETTLEANYVDLSTTKYCVTSTAVLNKKKKYIVKNLTQFETLAGANNFDDAIVADNEVYFNPRKNIWEVNANDPTTVAIFNFAIQEDVTSHIRIINNTKLEARNLFVSKATNRIDFVEISGNQNVDVDSIFVGQYDVAKFVLKHNTIREHNVAVNETAIADDVEIVGNMFYENHNLRPVIRALDSITFTDNEVKANPDYIGKKTEYGYSSPTSQEAITFASDNDGEIILENNRISAGLSRNGCVRITDCGVLRLINNEFDQHATDTAYTTRNTIVFNSVSGLTAVYAQGNRHIIENVAGEKVIYSLSNASPQTIARFESKAETLLKTVTPTYMMKGSNFTITNFVREKLAVKPGTVFDGTITTETSDVGAAQTNSTAQDTAAIVSDFNALLAKLRAAGLLKE